MLQYWHHLLPTTGRALDLACGLGQNAFFLADQGLSVDAWDISEIAVTRIKQRAQKLDLPVAATCIDVCKTWPEATFDFILVSAYLERSICPQLVQRLNPNGILFYHTFNNIPNGNKPNNPDFLLEADELLSLFRGLMPLVYLDDLADNDNTDEASIYLANRGKALLIARKR